MIARHLKIVPPLTAPVAEGPERAHFSVADVFLSAELCRPDSPGAPSVISVWGSDRTGVELGDVELDTEGLDSLLGDVDAFAAQLRELRVQLTGTAGVGR